MRRNAKRYEVAYNDPRNGGVLVELTLDVDRATPCHAQAFDTLVRSVGEYATACSRTAPVHLNGKPPAGDECCQRYTRTCAGWRTADALSADLTSAGEARDAWRAYAEHTESCVECAQTSWENCHECVALRTAATQADELIDPGYGADSGACGRLAPVHLNGHRAGGSDAS